LTPLYPVTTFVKVAFD